MKIKRFFHHIREFIRQCWLDGIDSDEYIKYLRKHGVCVGQNVYFRHPSHNSIDITRPCLVEFGNDLDINENFTVLTHDFGSFVFRGYYKDFINSSGKVVIGNNIVFGRNVTILKGVTIGDNCIIGAGSIVSRSIPANSIAVGVPARVICSLDDYYKKRKTLQVAEAIEYARELATFKGGVENLSIGDFSEEWVLFLCEKEYMQNPSIKKHVDFRLKGIIDVHEFLNRDKPFANYQDFIDEVKKDLKK